jgi:hypothetical protein
MKVLVLALVSSLALMTGCKKETPPGNRSGTPAAGKLATQLLGKWNDQDDGSAAYEFMGDGKCKAFGDMDCTYEVGSESATVLSLRYKAVDKWEDIEVTFEPPDKATWKNLTMAKTDPESAEVKLARAK